MCCCRYGVSSADDGGRSRVARQQEVNTSGALTLRQSQLLGLGEFVGVAHSVGAGYTPSQ